MEKKSYHRLSKEEKDKITKVISEVLNSEERVIFAYLYGSFVKEDLFRDIEIFVFIASNVDAFTFPIGLKEKLIDALIQAGIHYFSSGDLDVNVLNYAPYDFAIDVLSDGLLLVDKNPDFRTDYIEYISDQYRINQFILEDYTNES